nr:hypothetical protein [Paenibacillus bovis]
MSKTKIIFSLLLGVIASQFIFGFLDSLGLYFSLANVWHFIFGEPTTFSVTIVTLITIVLCYFPIRFLYKRNVESKY